LKDRNHDRAKNQHANPSKNRTPRHRAREFALQGLYQWLLNKRRRRRSPPTSGRARLRQGRRRTLQRAAARRHQATPELRAQIAPLIDRASPSCRRSSTRAADRRLRAEEPPEIPYRVVINEAVELTKSFGGIDGHKYVNGVLDKLAARVRTTEAQADKK
jgi:N utilization substance protein B